MKTSLPDKDNLNESQLEHLFESFLLNQLPYLFWMYEMIDGEYKLIKWNKNQEIFTEYSSEELYHMTPSDFFNKKDFKEVEIAISDVFKKGKSSVYADLLTKSGKLMPHYFEGYKFNFENRKIFAGISVDVSEYSKLKKRLQVTENEKQFLVNENLKVKEQLLNFSTQIFQNNKINNILDRHVNKIIESDNIDYIKNEIIELKKIIKKQQDSQENWELYKTRFNEFNRDFLKKLKTAHPDLTKGELTYCAYIKMKTPPSEIASILNISPEGIKKKRYRIRKKFHLQRNDSLDLYISRI